jgi:hypothetical protein
MRLRLLLAIIAVYFALLSACNSDKMAQLEKKNNELAAKLEAVSRAQDLDFQQKCAQGAKEAFRTSGISGPTSGFTNHYNTRLRKCFVYMTSTAPKENLVISAFVQDAFEGKTYGEYHQFANGTCYCSAGVGDDETTCRSFKEFDHLMKPYMEQ